MKRWARGYHIRIVDFDISIPSIDGGYPQEEVPSHKKIPESEGAQFRASVRACKSTDVHVIQLLRCSAGWRGHHPRDKSPRSARRPRGDNHEPTISNRP
ncbi:hypothetical protein ACLOJK_015782 [Asimina triloba]